MTFATVPISIDDPINVRILTVSEDQVLGFHRDPIGFIAQASGVDPDTVLERIVAMMRARTIRRVRQTLITTSLTPGALVAWIVPAARLDHAFDFMFREDPFTGHVVIRSTDRHGPGSEFRLWTTVKVPVGYCVERHCEYLARQTGAERFLPLPARKLFALGVGHVRRRMIEPGDRTDRPARARDTEVIELSDEEWRVLTALKRPFNPEQITRDPWAPRADEAGLSLDVFCAVGRRLSERGVVGRFSTFLEHVARLQDGTTVTRYNGLFHWAVPPGSEIAAGEEVGRHLVMTHAYWRDAGPDFNHVNIMGVAHGHDKDRLLAHKAAIDEHLGQIGIPIRHTSVFWGGRSEIKPSEIAPQAYRDWCLSRAIDPDTMRR